MSETFTKFFMTALAAAAVLAAINHSLAQDADLQRAYEACRTHAVYAPIRPLRQTGWEAGWEDCQKVDDAWHEAKQANDEASRRHMLETVLPKLH